MKGINNHLLIIGRLRVLLWFSLLLGLPLPSPAEPPLPYAGPGKHLGVVTCAGSTCHGATEPFPNTPILQTEYVTWSRDDKHSKAYQVLLSDESKRIAGNLGLPAAHTAELCLECHADYVPEELRGPRFQLSDGVGCEACHGGSGPGVNANVHSGWLGIHTAGVTHQQNLQAGLYPTEDPLQRSRLCLSCHFGNEKRFVTHRIMGAGHPRMSFELDTFTAIQPAHFEVDEDYKNRKPFWKGVQVWAIGQVMMVDSYLEAMVDPQRNRDGMFPELVLFDCHACHAPLSEKFWQPHPERGIGPGRVRINDANMLILARIIHHIDSASGRRFSASMRQLHQATANDYQAFLTAAKDLRASIPELNNQIAQYDFSNQDMQAILNILVIDGINGRFRDYGAAEQVAMAISTLFSTLEKSDAAMAEKTDAFNKALNKVYVSLENPDRYRPWEFSNALKSVRSAIAN